MTQTVSLRLLDIVIAGLERLIDEVQPDDFPLDDEGERAALEIEAECQEVRIETGKYRAMVAARGDGGGV